MPHSSIRLKRFFDILFSLVLIAILLPFMLPVMLALRLTAEGKVFYRQERIGLKNRRFFIWKFATMLQNSPNLGTGMITVRNDFRVTPVGKYLRVTKINELPQIINVLLGDMSMVGPRPLVDKTFSAYSVETQKMIYNVKPGITGIGSILFRDEEKLLSSTDMNPHDFYRAYVAPYKGELEIWYQRHASFGADLAILFLTAWQIFFPHSDLAFAIFKNLPERPQPLTLNGLKTLRSEGVLT